MSDHPLCSSMAQKAHYTDHYSECPKYPLACPNRCGVTGIRCRAMPDHHSSCPLEPLNCPFKDAGCTEKIARKDMEDHMTANQQKHMQQSNQHMKLLKQELDTTKEEFQNTKQQLQITTVRAQVNWRHTDISSERLHSAEEGK